MFIGAVKWFDNQKGFGILALPSKEELFVHIRGFKAFPDEGLQPSQIVFGNKKLDPKKNSLIAQNCLILKNPDDWKFVIALLEKDDTILLPSQKRKEQKYHLSVLAAKQLLQGQTEEGILNMITSNFDDSFEPSLFIPYAEFLDKNLPRIFEKESATPLLARIYEYFGNHITHQILFKVWQNRKFRYIGYPMDGDYEIPEEVLNLNATEISHEDLARIREYSFGRSFCSDFVSALLDDVDEKNREEVNFLIPYIDLLEDKDRAYWNTIVNS